MNLKSYLHRKLMTLMFWRLPAAQGVVNRQPSCVRATGAQTAKAIDPRPEGVYCRWETLGFQSMHLPRELVVEKVWGDGTVTEFRCVHAEAKQIAAFVNSGELK